MNVARRLSSVTRASFLAAFGIIAVLAILTVWEVWATMESRQSLAHVNEAKELSDQYQSASIKFGNVEAAVLTALAYGEQGKVARQELDAMLEDALGSVMRIVELGDASDRALVQRLLDDYLPSLRMFQALMETGADMTTISKQIPTPDAVVVIRTEFFERSEERKATAAALIAGYQENQDLRLAVTIALNAAGLCLVLGLVKALRHFGKREAALAAMAAAQPQLEAARDQADRANRAKSEFLSRMSHELRTPMNAVLGFGQLLEMDDLTPGQRENLAYIMSSGRHLLGLIDEVLDISRIESGRLSLSIEPISLTAIVSEVVEMTAPLAAESGITVRVAAPRAEIHAIADVQRTKQILLNLVSNAIKYNRPQGSVTVALERDEDRHATVAVSDTGWGLPPDKMDRVFSPFDRLGAESTGVEGTGLGLALSKALAEAMNGSLGVQNGAVGGATFTLTLPVPAESTEPRPHAEVVAIRTRGATVVCIEDNHANYELIAQCLGSQLRMRVVSATTGRSGLRLVHEEQPALVVLDIDLPDMSGHDVLARLRADDATTAIPVIVTSATNGAHVGADVVEAGAAAFLPKPLELGRLVAIVRGVLAEEERAAA